MSSDHSTSCPCKAMSWSLSSFTAAEFGDVSALSQALSKNEGRRNRDLEEDAGGGGITPLHLAAQHGHAGATWLLLQKGHPVDGGNGSRCTPLHRAAFSGAIATMRLLLEHGADRLACDESFGDGRTPLHKAAAGGRYLAVALLLDALRNEPSLASALAALDRNRLTPLQVARSCRDRPSEHRPSVARWDAVAGGTVADWDKCVTLLSDAEQEVRAEGRRNPLVTIPANLPRHPLDDGNCFQCPENGECITYTWSVAFQKALQQSVCIPVSANEILPPEPNLTNEELLIDEVDTPQTQNGATELLEESRNSGDPVATTSTGRPCESCGVHCIVLFPSVCGGLVCRRCKRRKRN